MNSITRRLAVLLTCHNRREATLGALRGLFSQRLSPGTGLTAFLVDDGCTDGTGETVRSEFPQVRLLRGDGSLYWSSGMRWAFAEALKEDFDYYFWLNDDSLLDCDALARMVECSVKLTAHGHDQSIVVGSLRDPDSGCLTYGGVVRSSPIHRLKFRWVNPSEEPQCCDTMNGNAVLIPRSVAAITGNISASFTHGMGDFDYGLRAGKLGCTVWTAPGYVGTCRKNDAKNTFLDAALPLQERLRKMRTLKGLPAGEYRNFARAHGGILWPVLWMLPYIRITLQSLLQALTHGKTKTPA